MPLPLDLQGVSGAQELFDWFGYWPGFHDAEVVRFSLDVAGPSLLTVRTWQMTDRVDERGFYELTKKAVVELTLEEVSSVTLLDLWANSILLDLNVTKTEAGFLLSMSAAYGMTGTIEVGKLGIRITPER